MAFKKLDSDLTAGEEPLDAFVLRGVAANVEAGFEGRLRRASMSFAPSSDGNGGTTYPRYGCSRWMYLPLFPWRVSSRRVDKIRVKLNGTVSDFPVNMQLAYRVTESRESSLGPIVTIDPAVSTDFFQELEIDLRAADPEKPLAIFLVFRSDQDPSESPGKTVAFPASTTFFESRTILNTGPANGLGILNNTRYVGRVEFDSVSPAVTDNPYPIDLDVIWWDPAKGTNDKDKLGIWPPQDVSGQQWQSLGSFSFRLIEIGSFTLKGLSIQEEIAGNLSDLNESLYPGLPPRVSSCSESYSRARELFTNRTRVYSVGVPPDRNNPEGTDSTGRLSYPNGTIVGYSDLQQISIGFAAGTTYRVTIDGVNVDTVSAASEVLTLQSIAGACAIQFRGKYAFVVTTTGGFTSNVLRVTDLRGVAPDITVSIVAGPGTISLDDDGYVTGASAFLGDIGTDQQEEVTGGAVARPGIEALALVAISEAGNVDPSTFRVDARLKLNSWGGLIWDAQEDESLQTIGGTDFPGGRTYELQSHRYYTASNGDDDGTLMGWNYTDWGTPSPGTTSIGLPMYHHLRGLWSQMPGQDLVICSARVDDTFPGAADRMLRMQFRGRRNSVDGKPGNSFDRRLHVMGMTVLAQQGPF